MWPAPGAKARGVRWGRAEHPLPRPKPSDPTSKERGGEVGQKRDTGDDATRRGARVVPRREWKGGREGGIEPPFPPDPYSAHCPPPSCVAPQPLPPERPLGPTTHPGRTTFQTSFPPYLPIRRHTIGGEAHEPGWGGVGFWGNRNTNPNPKLTLSLMLNQTRVWGCGVLGWRVR